MERDGLKPSAGLICIYFKYIAHADTKYRVNIVDQSIVTRLSRFYREILHAIDVDIARVDRVEKSRFAQPARSTRHYCYHKLRLVGSHSAERIKGPRSPSLSFSLSRLVL